jgi:hypothetical protein
MFRYALFCTFILVVLLYGCPGPGPATFTLTVVPEEIEDTIPGQLCVLLVTIEEVDSAATNGSVTITASAQGATAVVERDTLTEGEVAEVSVTMLPPEAGAVEPAGESEGWPCNVTVRAERGGAYREVDVPITLTSEEEDFLAPTAAEMRELFIPWLEEHQPDLGIDETTVWEGTIVKPHWLVVSHYLFFSDEWEMHVSWHIMIAPYDWARIELRRRFEETLPSLAFEIPSVSAPDPVAVNQIDPEGILWR